MLNYKIKIGLVPDVRDLFDFATRKGIFEPAKGVESKNKLVKYLKENFADEMTEFVDLEWLNEYGVVYKNADADKVADYMKAEKVDTKPRCASASTRNSADRLPRRLAFPYFSGVLRTWCSRKTVRDTPMPSADSLPSASS